MKLLKTLFVSSFLVTVLVKSYLLITHDETEKSQAFFERLQAACGQSFIANKADAAGELAELAKNTFTATVEHCDDDAVKVRFKVGNDTSRVWLFERNDHSIALTHVHESKPQFAQKKGNTIVNNYGGKADYRGTPYRQYFPADEATALILPEAATNEWVVELSEDGQNLVYRVTRNEQLRFTARMTRQS